MEMLSALLEISNWSAGVEREVASRHQENETQLEDNWPVQQQLLMRSTRLHAASGKQ